MKHVAAAGAAVLLLWGAMLDRWELTPEETSTRTELDEAFEIGYTVGHCMGKDGRTGYAGPDDPCVLEVRDRVEDLYAQAYGVHA